MIGEHFTCINIVLIQYHRMPESLIQDWQLCHLILENLPSLITVPCSYLRCKVRARHSSSLLRELAKELAKALSIIYQQSWLTGEVLHDWRITNVTPIYKKGQKEDPGN